MRLIPTVARRGREWPGGEPEDHGQQVAEGRGRRQADRDRRRDHEGGAADDQREGEEERALDATGQRHEQRRDGDRHGALDDELRRPERVRRQQVVDDEDEQPGQREQHEDRAPGSRATAR